MQLHPIDLDESEYLEREKEKEKEMNQVMVRKVQLTEMVIIYLMGLLLVN